MKKILVIILLLIPFLVFAQEDTQKKQAYFFFLPDCPHCQNVEKYFDDNGIWDKYQITKMDASNPFNGRLLLKFQDIFADSFKGSVPVIVFGDKYIEGDRPIINDFVNKIEASDNANSLPNPDKLTNNAATPASQPVTGNKKSYLPVVIGALVVVGAGALIYINRKK